ncbi:MAG: glycoside hydrolase family 32 protein [Verrucomicrobia bacterium]|nr:MAG: glycoside hydrolase family 32 protein [Verrucomicrobiota bacterium]
MIFPARMKHFNSPTPMHTPTRIIRPLWSWLACLALLAATSALPAQGATGDTPAKQQPAPPSDNTREVKITGKYIIFPVSNKGQRSRMTIRVGEQLVHNLDCDFPPNKESIDWWGWLDVSEYLGKTAIISAKADPEVAAMIESSNQLRNLQPLYDEALRPQFHMSQMRGWNNDPNGMCYYDGSYHFFWQSNPAGAPWANMYWGHATSPDMVHWSEQAHALRPFGDNVANRHQSMARACCFSGSGNVDTNNSAGFQKGKEKTMVLVFTDTGCGESLAYSTNRGKTWTYYEGNPVIKHSGRDPKLIWYAPGKHWVITLFDERAPFGQNISIYTSKDLKQWEYASSITGFFECAEMFELPVDGNKDNKKWVMFAADAQYVIGNFDGKKFTPEHQGKHQVHWGPYYASQCFSNSPDGRVVQIGWARIDMPGMPFNQAFSLPTQLTLHTTDEGIRMYADPIKELEGLRKPKPKKETNKVLTAEAGTLEMAATGQTYDIVVTLKKGSASQAVLHFGENVVTYDFGSQRLDDMPLKMQNDKVTFRVLVDRPMFEVSGGGGACYKTAGRRDMGKPLGKISLSAQGGTLTVESLTVHEMNSAWKKP